MELDGRWRAELWLLEHTEPVPPALNPVPLFGEYLPGLVDLYRFAHRKLQAVRRPAGSAVEVSC